MSGEERRERGQAQGLPLPEFEGEGGGGASVAGGEITTVGVSTAKKPGCTALESGLCPISFD